jgi:hypothetical protein
VEIIFGEINGAAILGNEGMGVAQLAARFIELQARTAGKPDGGNPLMIERGGEFIEPWETLAAGGNQRIYCDVENTGCLPQAMLRSDQNILSETRVGSSP